MSDGGLTLQTGSRISFDTYFNAFFERQWRTHTSVRDVHLNLELDGRAVLRLWRRAVGDCDLLLHESIVSQSASIAIPQPGAHPRQSGLVWFDATALDAPVTIRSGSWSALCPVSVPASLGIVICTMNREPEVAGVLTAMDGDAGLAAVIGRVIVVNQGRPELRLRLPPAAGWLHQRLTIIEQANFGGAGGFGRGTIETLDDPAITHVCMLDDDVQLEPECLFRMAAFFSAARGEIALGGHMLDGVQPTRLYEAGARVRGDGVLEPLRPADDLADGRALGRLLDSAPMHYNGWWLFGVDKTIIRRLGLPLPCFIRGDDVEFGLRLHDAGIPTIGLPGVAIWHEPFYLKIGGWQLYYEVRNALIVMALHQGFGRKHVALVAFKYLMTYLLTFRYGSAALVVRALQDFSRGPALLRAPPISLHAEIVALRGGYQEERTLSQQVLPEAFVKASPRSVPGFFVRFIRAVVRNWLAPTEASAEPRWLLAADLVWFRVVDADCLAVDTYWDSEFPTYRRDRAAFRALFRSGVAATLRLFRQATSLHFQWQNAAPFLTSERFWRGYLDLPATCDAARSAGGERGAFEHAEMDLVQEEHRSV